MTAINLLLMPNGSHVFADAGHYNNDMQLVEFKSKVFPLQNWNAVCMFQGPSIGGPLLHESLHNAQRLCFDWRTVFPHVVNEIKHQIGKRPFSAFIVGYNNRAPFGMAIEEGGRVHKLGVGSMIKSLRCAVEFDPQDIVTSGLAMMRQQRADWPVVGGWCDYTSVSNEGIKSRVLERWMGSNG